MNGYLTRSSSNNSPMKSTQRNTTLFEYPKDAKTNPMMGIISFTEHDKAQLKSPRFLNDTIISFFMQYHLDDCVTKEIKNRVHVFSSFFFSKIKSLKECKEDEKEFKCASRWLKGVKIFNKDFLIMPVCEKDHWVLVIVCYPYNRPSENPELIPDDELREPAVFVLNSWYGYAPSVKKALNQFLKFQWHIEREELRPFSIRHYQSKDKHRETNMIRLIFPTLPQQRNNYNCGVFLLNFFYCFLKNPRENYIKMFREKDMSHWFKDNDIKIQEERRRMANVIKTLQEAWDNSEHNSRRVKEESQEVLVESSSQSSDTSSDFIEEDDSSKHVIVIR